MTDFYLFQTPDGGDSGVNNNDIVTTEGVGTAIYLSLFGGNEDDPGGDNRKKDWWGNLDESEPKLWYRSETQYLVRSLPATSSNLKRIEEAVKRDLAWMSESIAESLEIKVTIPKLNWVQIVINIVINGEAQSYMIPVEWRTAA